MLVNCLTYTFANVGKYFLNERFVVLSSALQIGLLLLSLLAQRDSFAYCA